MLIASFVLLVLGGEPAQLEGAIKYVTLNLVSSAFFLTAIGLLYGAVGTLNFADLARQLPHLQRDGLVTVLGMLFLVAFGIKGAIFPLFFWLPASYHTPPVAVSTIFSGLLTKVGLYSMVRVFTLLFVHDTAFTHTVLLVLSGFTMVTGVLGAVAQSELRRLLSFHIVSQIGYLLMGLGLFTPLALAGTVFFMVHVVLAKSALFLVSGITHRLVATYDLKKLGGFYADSPSLSLLFLAPALSLAGVPPLSGFWAKLVLVRAGLEAGHYAIVAVALVVSILTLFSMTKIWAEVFWKDRVVGAGTPESLSVARIPARDRALLIGPTAGLALLMVALGLGGDVLLALARDTARELLDTERYVAAVLAARP